jgi:hypothetical protein
MNQSQTDKVMISAELNKVNSFVLEYMPGSQRKKRRTLIASEEVRLIVADCASTDDLVAAKAAYLSTFSISGFDPDPELIDEYLGKGVAEFMQQIPDGDEQAGLAGHMELLEQTKPSLLWAAACRDLRVLRFIHQQMLDLGAVAGVMIMQASPDSIQSFFNKYLQLLQEHLPDSHIFKSFKDLKSKFDYLFWRPEQPA